MKCINQKRKHYTKYFWEILISTIPHYQYESVYEGSVCGIDEAGRGPLAGSVFAAAVTLNPLHVPNGLNDSKKLSKQKRDMLARTLFDYADIGIGMASVAEIDELNILHATMLAMQRAYAALKHPTQYALIDGNRCPALPCVTQSIIKGDGISISIAAASIIAKVTRDNAMHALDTLYPHYGFARHAGYGTKQHVEAMRTHGITPQHRRSFRPVKECMMRERMGREYMP